MERRGPIGDLLAPVVRAPFGDAVLLRLLGGLHRSCSKVGRPSSPPTTPRWAARPGRGGSVLEAVGRTTTTRWRAGSRGRADQRGRVGPRLVGGLLELARLGLPLRVLEVGSSAGLNLLFDRYRYDAGDRAFGDPARRWGSTDPWIGGAPDLSVDVGWRAAGAATGPR